ncbi:hypothetical protein [Pseudoalteromonas xiamenensis]
MPAKGDRYIMKLKDGQYLGYPKGTKIDEEHDLIVVEKEEDAILINRSTKSVVEKGYYTWAFYPHGENKKGKRIDYRLKGDFRRIFGNKNDSLAVSWKPENEDGTGKFFSVMPPKTQQEVIRPRLGNKEGKLIAVANGGYDITLIKKS